LDLVAKEVEAEKLTKKIEFIHVQQFRLPRLSIPKKRHQRILQYRVVALAGLDVLMTRRNNN
jgi:hypothetical protein